MQPRSCETPPSSVCKRVNETELECRAPMGNPDTHHPYPHIPTQALFFPQNHWSQQKITTLLGQYHFTIFPKYVPNGKATVRALQCYPFMGTGISTKWSPQNWCHRLGASSACMPYNPRRALTPGLVNLPFFAHLSQPIWERAGERHCTQKWW